MNLLLDKEFPKAGSGKVSSGRTCMAWPSLFQVTHKYSGKKFLLRCNREYLLIGPASDYVFIKKGWFKNP